MPVTPREAATDDEVYSGGAAFAGAGFPGDVLLYRSRSFPLFGANGWLVLYRSTDALGNPDAVSGMVIVPTAAWAGPGPRPIIAFAHATVGVTDDCAPTRNIASGLYMENTYLSQVLAKGWAVALTDYEGLGTPGRHTYCVNRSEGRAVLDAVRAAARTPGAGLEASAPVVIWGYSQGGGAAGAAAEAAATYAPELGIKGIAAGGPAADLEAIGAAGEGTMFFGFVAAGSQGLDAAYPELNLRSYLNAAGLKQYDASEAQGACLPQLLGADYAFKRTTDFSTTDPRGTPAWQRRFAENRLGAAKLGFPAFVYHGLVDEVIPNAVGTGLRDRWCAQGSTVQWGDYLGDHVLTQSLAAGDVVQWIADRLDGRPSRSDCR